MTWNLYLSSFDWFYLNISFLYPWKGYFTNETRDLCYAQGIDDLNILIPTVITHISQYLW